MPGTNRTPAFNLKAVLKETGLKADVLRAWERRYNLPRPQRTPGGHRLYSEFDIETIKWLRARQAEGVSISRAVDLWNETMAAGRDPLKEVSAGNVPFVSQRPPASDTTLDSLRRAWLDANLAFDSLQVDELLNQAFALYPVERVCTEILQRGISEIGDYWYQGKASVQQEHFATALASRRLETIIASSPRPTRPQRIWMGCPPGERHAFSVLLLTLFLRRDGLDVVYLGADTPLEASSDPSAVSQVDLVVLAAQQLTTAAALQSMAFTLGGRGIAVAYGGLIFNRVPQLRERIPGYFLGESLLEAVASIERLMAAPAVIPVVPDLDAAQRETTRLYQQKRPLIELSLVEALQKQGLPVDYLNETNLFFGNALSAALSLGDPAYIEADLEWVTHLLAGRRISVDELIAYLTAYSLLIDDHMGKAGRMVTDWLDAYLSNWKKNYETHLLAD